jgi:hypothetical protein
MSPGKLAVTTAISVAGGALVGHYIDSHKGTAVGFNTATGAIGGGLVGLIGGGLAGGAVKGFREGAGQSALIGGAIGAVGLGAVGAGVGALNGWVNYTLNHALSNALGIGPTISGAAIAGGYTLVTGLMKMSHQHEEAKKAA